MLGYVAASVPTTQAQHNIMQEQILCQLLRTEKSVDSRVQQSVEAYPIRKVFHNEKRLSHYVQ